VLSKIQLTCETLFPPRMSVTITFLTYSSYTSQSIAVVQQLHFTYLLHVSHETHQNLIGYISAICKPIHFWFSPKLSAVQGLQIQPEVPTHPDQFRNSNFNP